MKRILDREGWNLEILEDFLNYSACLTKGTFFDYFISRKQWARYNRLLEDLHIKLILMHFKQFDGMGKYSTRIKQLESLMIDNILEDIFRLLCIPDGLSSRIIGIYVCREHNYIIRGHIQRMMPEYLNRLKEISTELELLESLDNMTFGEKDIKRNYLHAEIKHIKEGSSYLPKMPAKTNKKIFKKYFEEQVGTLLCSYYKSEIYEECKNKNWRKLIHRALKCGLNLSSVSDLLNGNESKIEELICKKELATDLNVSSPPAKYTYDFFKSKTDSTENAKVLFVHGGLIKCQRDKHDIQSIKAVVKTLKGKVNINANYCRQCQVSFISYDELKYYNEVYGAIFADFRWISEDGEYTNELDYDLHPSKSPLFLCGYNVDANLGLKKKERQSILAQIIFYGILKKHEIIKYLSYFIKRNGQIKSHGLAKEKWLEDLEFVRKYKLQEQEEVVVDRIERITERRR